MKALIRDIPQAPGVYFFYSAEGELIYIGKSINLRKRLIQHAQGSDRKSQKIQQQTARIEYELTGSDLIAELHEEDLIKQHQPRINRMLRRTKMPWAIVLYQVGGYLSLQVEVISKTKQQQLPLETEVDNFTAGKIITAVATRREGVRILRAIGKKYFLCNKINGLEGRGGSCFAWQIRRCFGACLGQEPADEYNARVRYFIEKQQMPSFSGWIVLPGRTAKEKGLVLLEGGVYRGFGFCGKRVPERNYHRYLQPKQDTRDSKRILRRYFLQLALPDTAADEDDDNTAVQ